MPRGRFFEDLRLGVAHLAVRFRTCRKGCRKLGREVEGFMTEILPIVFASSSWTFVTWLGASVKRHAADPNE